MSFMQSARSRLYTVSTKERREVCMDPVTIIVGALVAGAAAGLKPTVEQAVKDAYLD
jgi:hypothetical protein